MSTLAVIVPFDMFGSAGAGAGAQLVADAMREMLADNRRERKATRARSYQKHVRLKEFSFESLADYESWRPKARKTVKQSLGKNQFLLWIGGNHVSVLPVLEEIGTMPGSLVVQLDAHLDVYTLTDCTEQLSHGNFLLHADSKLPPILHVGHRDLFLPTESIEAHFEESYSAEDLALSLETSLYRLRAQTLSAKRVWIDIDCDVLDPAHFPAVDGPQPFGLLPTTLLRILDAVWSDRVAGVSISEFVPARDRNDQSLGLLIWLIEWLLLRRYDQRKAQEESGDEEE
jgi:arginase family enzyme